MKLITNLLSIIIWVFIAMPTGNTSIAVKNVLKTKKGVYLENGIFQGGATKGSSELKSIRHANRLDRIFERLVLDLSSKDLPETYVFVSSADGKINIDLRSVFKDQDNEIAKFLNSL